jgi:catechol 2,3-dioxygenase-like lactoylglutathione lyase family enzyme
VLLRAHGLVAFRHRAILHRARDAAARANAVYAACMSVHLNHTIVHARDPRASAELYASLLELPPPVPFGPFFGVALANDVTLDFLGAGGMEIQTQHYAFLVTDAEFDRIFARIEERKMDFWADPHRTQKGRINDHFGGRGFYFEDPNGHLLEVMTRPYGRVFPKRESA